MKKIWLKAVQTTHPTIFKSVSWYIEIGLNVGSKSSIVISFIIQNITDSIFIKTIHVKTMSPNRVKNVI